MSGWIGLDDLEFRLLGEAISPPDFLPINSTEAEVDAFERLWKVFWRSKKPTSLRILTGPSLTTSSRLSSDASFTDWSKRFDLESSPC